MHYHYRLQILGSGPLKKEEIVVTSSKFFFNGDAIPQHVLDIFFECSRAEMTGGHSWKVAKQQSNKDCRFHFFSFRVVKLMEQSQLMLLMLQLSMVSRDHLIGYNNNGWASLWTDFKLALLATWTCTG